MTISSTARKAGPFSGTGLQNAFPFAFKVFSAGDVLVVQTDGTGTEHPLTLGGNCSVTLGGNCSVTLNADQDASPGGTVTLSTALPVGQLLTISSSIPITQGVSIPNMGGFYPRVIEQALDKLTIAAQQIAEATARSLRFALSDSNASGALPTSAVRTGKFLAFDAIGNPTAASGTGADAALRTDLSSDAGGSSLISFILAAMGARKRTLGDKSQDVVSIEDFDAPGGDDAIAVRAALAELKRRGGGVLVASKASYLLKSYVSPPGAVGWQNDPCVLLDGCGNITFLCGGATFMIDGAIAGAHANGSGASHFGFHNCKDLFGVLPRMVGNRTGLAADKFNNGAWFESCVNVPLALRFAGDFNGGSCMAGGHVFDTHFPPMLVEHASLPVDMTCLENVTFESIVVTNPASTFVTGFKLFTDPVSSSYNVTGRALVAGMSSNVHVKRISANGADTAIYVDGVDGFSAQVDAFSGKHAAVIETSAATHALGKITKNVMISGIARSLTGSAVVLNTQGYGLDGVFVQQFKAENCADYAVSSLNNANLGIVTITDCDFSKQAQTIENAFAQDIGNAGGAIVNVHGYNPRSIAINRALPGATGIANESVNNWPFAVEVTVNTTGAEYVMHIVEPDGTDINLGTAGPKVPQAVTLSPKEAIYFEAALPTQWQWRGL